MIRRAAILATAVSLMGVASARAAEPQHATPFAAHIITPSLPVRAKPDGGSRVIRLLRQFRHDYRPTVILAIARRTRAGQRWYQIRLPGRPNGRTGWVTGERLQWIRAAGAVALDLDLSQRRMRVRREGPTVRSSTVAVG